MASSPFIFRLSTENFRFLDFWLERVIFSIGDWWDIPSDSLHPRNPCRHNACSNYMCILTKINFSINHMNLSKFKDFHAWVFGKIFFRIQLFLAGIIFSAICMDRILKQKIHFVFSTHISAKTKELHVWVWMVDKTSFPIYFILAFLVGKIFFL